MQRRMYGMTRLALPRQPLKQLENERWLTTKSSVRLWGYVCLGVGGVFFAALVLGPLTDPTSGTSHLLFWLCIFSGVIEVYALGALISASMWTTTHQYCPDCLSDMTRGATVCPFCGFRERTPPDTPTQTSTHQRMRS
jgi:hypothetical protein